MNNLKKLVIELVIGSILFCWSIAGIGLSKERKDEEKITETYIVLTFSLIIIAHGIITFIKKKYESPLLSKLMKNLKKFQGYEKVHIFITLMIILLLIIFVVVKIILSNGNQNNFSLLTYLTYLILMFLVNLYKTRGKPNFNIAIRGVFFHIILILFVLETKIGYDLFDYLSLLIVNIINFSNFGKIFLFGENYTEHNFVFSVLPAIIFVGAIMSLITYWGLVQKFIKIFGNFISFILGCNNIDGGIGTANIFLSLSETPFMFKNILPKFTETQMSTIMICGFSSISIALFSPFVEMGVDRVDLITSSVISTPIAIMLSYIYEPEIFVSDETIENDDEILETPVEIDGMVTLENLPSEIISSPPTFIEDVIEIEVEEYFNSYHAFCMGAINGLQVAGGIGVCILVTIGGVEFLNVAVQTFFSIIYVDADLYFILQYVFYPLIYSLAINPDDVMICSSFLTTKILINEYVAFDQMTSYINRTGEKFTNFEINWIDLKSQRVMTYLLANFANFACIGMMVSTLLILVPQKKRYVLKSVFNCFLIANVVSLMNASMISIFINK